MADLVVVQTIKTELVAGFTAAPVKEITGGKLPPDASGFVTLQFPVNNSEKMTLGNLYRDSGAFRVVISVERGHEANLNTGLQWAGQIATLFRDKTFDRIKTSAPTIGRLDDSNEEGNFYVLSVLVPYTFNYRG